MKKNAKWWVYQNASKHWTRIFLWAVEYLGHDCQYMKADVTEETHMRSIIRSRVCPVIPPG